MPRFSHIAGLFLACFLTLGAVAQAQTPAPPPPCPENFRGNEQICRDYQKNFLDLSKKALESPGTAVTQALTDPRQLNEWVNLGKNVGVALSSAAKELGTGVQEFAKTDVGFWVTILIVWKLIGKSMILLGFALFFLVIMNGIFLRLLWSSFYKQATSVETTTQPDGAILKKEVTKFKDGGDERAATACIALVVSTLIGIVCFINV